VRTSGRGPVLFRQVRVGRRGREFVMLKFRTMVDGAADRLSSVEHLNETDGALFKIRSDPRVTRGGRFLRRHSLDELPQLWNVFRGQMSIVGPRPPLPSEVAGYGTAAHRRLLVKPGISGLWQVSGRSELSWDESIRLDLYYVENWSPALDAQILFRTVGAVVRGRGAY
jgi:lipopolysaccharide/colanic/teichoic acid biosynthesis glycosyltransferase